MPLASTAKYPRIVGKILACKRLMLGSRGRCGRWFAGFLWQSMTAR